MASLSPISFISIFISLLVLLVGNGAFSKQAVAGPGGSSAAAALAPGMLSFFVSDSRRRQAFQGSSYATVIIEKKLELLSIILVIGSLLPFSASDHQGDASYDMKLKLNAIGSQLFDWNQNQVNPCTWKSVICDNNNNVVQVSLPGNNNTGGIYTRAVWQPLSIDKEECGFVPFLCGCCEYTQLYKSKYIGDCLRGQKDETLVSSSGWFNMSVQELNPRAISSVGIALN